ncbi:oligosaccharide flippase family protein [Vibrio sp. 506]|uniref:lipopolysaccharide biosynthesis protein n=1 Tax=Vibrio sp. 506 TaxID=3074607 RepID=UPI002964E3CF|nr:oligosaccharide flippase family protein [Vibrio sp. 506]MDW2056803.1 oligosaccharide flippase family protein [Vibrio sp. 506]
MSVFKKGGLSFVIHIVGAMIGLVTQLLAASILGTEGYGKVNYVLGFVGSISIFFFFGYHYYFSKFAYNDEGLKEIISKAIFTSSIIYILSLPVVFVFLKEKLPLSELILVLFLVFFTFLLEIVKSFEIAKGNTVKASRVKNFDTKVITLVFSFVFYCVGYISYYTFLIAILVGFIFASMPGVISNFRFVAPSVNIVKSASTFYLVQVTYFFYSYFSKVIQMEIGSASLLGILSISLVIGQAISMIGTNFANVVLPVFSKAFKDGDLELAGEKFREVARLNAYLSLPLLVIIIVKYDIILSFIGEDYLLKESGIIVLFVLLGQFVNSFVGPNGSVLLMSGNEKTEIINGLIKLCVGISSAYFLGADFGWGIAFSLFFSELIVNLVKLVQVYHLFKLLPYSFKELRYLILMSLFQFSIVIILNDFISNIYALILFSFVFCLANWLLTFKLSPNNNDWISVSRVLNKCN